jgi:HAD superfamily hydrolase (TIGR01450 family)
MGRSIPDIAMMNVKALRVFFFDLDGVLSVGKENLRYLGGREIIRKLKKSGRKTFILTNDSTHVREEIHQNLIGLGFNLGVEEILTSSYLTAQYLTERFGQAPFFLVGENGLRRELEAAGHYLSDRPQAVVVGLDRQLNYEKLDNASRYLRAGAQLVGSYGGAVYMSDRGPALSAGPIIKALEFGSGKKVTLIGKPSPRMFRLALHLADEKAGKAVMIGDQIETDIVGARKAGVHTILVLTGVETKEAIRNSKIKPEVVIENVDALGGLI